MPRCKYCGWTYRLQSHTTHHERYICLLRPGAPDAQLAERVVKRVASLDDLTTTLIAQIRAARQADPAAAALLGRQLHEVRNERALVVRGRV
jgi:hypothetical protein